MTEAFLHYLWKNRLFHSLNLKTTDGEPLKIIFSGYHNTDAGPDFKQAIVQIGDLRWAGDVEIHIRSSDWYRHGHQHDDKYLSVALHVVYEHDCEVERKKGEPFPTLELKDRIPHDMLRQYENLVGSPLRLPCEPLLDQIDPLQFRALQSTMLVQRLLRKQKHILDIVRECDGDWKEAMFRLLAVGFGFKTNTDAFELMAKSLPYKVVAKHSDSAVQTAALVFGQAGMLQKNEQDDYYNALKGEYDYLRYKYQLIPIGERHWNLLRLRPSNFPCVRLAQFAALLHKVPDLTTECLRHPSTTYLKDIMSVSADPYWKNHYHFGKKTILPHGVALGDAALSLLIVNVIVPFLFAYQRFSGEEAKLEELVSMLDNLPFEDNKKTRIFKTTPFPMQSASDSQALLELFQFYCMTKHCLDCSVGECLVRNRGRKK